MAEDNVTPLRTDAQPQPDYAGAVAYALQRLRAELPPFFSYHDVSHTEHDVLPAVSRLARLAGLTDADRQVLEVAAAYHDLGHVQNHIGHEQIGVSVIDDVLPGFGFGARDIERISGMILATQLPQSPQNAHEALLADADLDSLGREDFFDTSEALWRERAALGYPVSWPEWLATQLAFLASHRYFSDAARTLRDAGKQRNIARLEQLIREQCDASARQG
ncbi:HD domain protein [Methyloversatilis sp. RAC08]|nr:HD domain protein [Methyloversatilis sp. RAC08]